MSCVHVVLACRRSSTEGSGYAWDYTSVIQGLRQQGYDGNNQAVHDPAVQHSLESLAVHDSAVQLSLKSLVIPTSAVQLLAGPGTAVQCGLGAPAGQDSAVQFKFATPAGQDATAGGHLQTLSESAGVQQANCAASEAGSSSGCDYTPALVPPPAVIQDWLRTQLISLGEEDTDLLQGFDFRGVKAGAGAAVGGGRGAAVGDLSTSAEEEVVLAWLRSSMVSLRAAGAAAGFTGGVRLGGEGPVSAQVGLAYVYHINCQQQRSRCLWAVFCTCH